MAKKSSGGTGCLIIIAIAWSLLSSAAAWATANPIIVATAIGAIIFVIVLIRLKNKKKHQAWVHYLQEKYNDDSIVSGILNGHVWKGQTAEQLEESLGSPAGVDRQVLKTKTKEVWKYNRTGKGQFAMRISLDNDVVVGWDKRA